MNTDAPRPRLLVLELWGLGDLSFSTPLLRAAREQFDVTVLGKPHARPLLQATFPEMEFIAYDAPWTAWEGKYHLWKWDWRELLILLARLRRRKFDVVVSVRADPRDHFFMWLTGATTRVGFPRRGSEAFLNLPIDRANERQHRVEDWQAIKRALALPPTGEPGPRLDHAAYRSPAVDELLGGLSGPLVCLHPGARIAVRRWPEPFFADILRRMRERYQFQLVLVPDTDGYGAGLVPLADRVLRPLAVNELVDVLGRVDVLLCNDSGPGHIAAACGRPAIPIFGPTDPDWFRPWGDLHRIVIRDICPWRPCKDYCKFREAHCMTKLSPDAAWHDIHTHLDALIARGALPAAMKKKNG